MTKVEGRIANNMECHGALFEFLGADNVEYMKKAIAEGIVKQVLNDLHDSYEYIISPDDMVADIVDDVMDKAKSAIKPKVEKALYERAMAKLGLED